MVMSQIPCSHRRLRSHVVRHNRPYGDALPLATGTFISDRHVVEAVFSDPPNGWETMIHNQRRIAGRQERYSKASLPITLFKPCLWFVLLSAYATALANAEELRGPLLDQHGEGGNRLWVSPDGFDSNDGSSSSPLATIQAAADRAAPGTAVLVRAGEYRENIKIPSSGTEDQPIWFVSVDGAGEANVKPQDQNLATFLGRGTDNIIIKDFAIDGADNRSGIEFTQSGVDFTNLVKNIVIEGNIIYDAGIDGIKIAQTENIQVIGNKISGGREEGIDFVTVWNATIAHNEVEDTQGPGGIVVKGGSNAIVIENNYVHDTAVDGIIVGGWTDAELFQIFQGFEASQITVRENVVEDVGKRPLNFLAAQDSTATNNFLDPNNDYFTIVNIEGDNLGLVSRDLTITDNTVTKENWIFVTPGHDQGHVIQNNSLGQSHTNLVGPEHQLSSQPTWLSNIRKAKADP